MRKVIAAACLLALVSAMLVLDAAEAVATGGARASAFSDFTRAAHISMPHRALAASPHEPRYLVTGQAWGDYDRDGWVDLYLTNQRGPNALYENRADGTFRRSALSSQVALASDASGGAVFADYDNDGWQDLYVASEGQDRLFHNDRGRAFTDVTGRAGITDGGRGMTASWGDYDGDGYLDLYVANYGCHPCDSPDLSEGDPDRLFHNEGDGGFTDVSDLLPGDKSAGWGFVAGWLDYDNDRDLDLYLVNDVRGTGYLPGNALLRNDGQGCNGWCFTDVSEESGAGVRADGMGLAVGDYDNDGDLDLYFSNTGWGMTPLTGPSVLLRNEGDGSFRDVAFDADADVDAIGWGTVFLDFDNDGWQDLYVGLGGASRHELSYATTNRLLQNAGDGTFRNVTDLSGAADSRDTFGVASADYNADGWPDLLIGNLGRGYALYANTGHWGRGNHRLTVRLRGGGPVNRDAVGARVYLSTTDGRTQLQEVAAGSSLGSGNEPALQFGLGRASVRRLRVIWPNGREQSFGQVPTDALWELAYGGKPRVSPLARVRVPVSPVRPVPEAEGVGWGGLVVPALAALLSLELLALVLAWRFGHQATARRLLVVLGLSGVSFQLGHFLEHLLQIGHWLGQPGEEPWITPWGLVATDGFTTLAGHHGGRASGTELLHLAGNWIFFTGLIALYAGTRGWHKRLPGMRALRLAFWLQLVHVVEHVALSTTFFAFGRPRGLSTLFGWTFSWEGPWAPSIRAWWHFLMNLAVTVAAVIAVWKLHRAGLLRAWSLGRPADYALQAGDGRSPAVGVEGSLQPATVGSLSPQNGDCQGGVTHESEPQADAPATQR